MSNLLFVEMLSKKITFRTFQEQNQVPRLIKELNNSKQYVKIPSGPNIKNIFI
jgi:hypothetical protein